MKASMRKIFVGAAKTCPHPALCATFPRYRGKGKPDSVIFENVAGMSRKHHGMFPRYGAYPRIRRMFVKSPNLRPDS